MSKPCRFCSATPIVTETRYRNSAHLEFICEDCAYYKDALKSCVICDAPSICFVADKDGSIADTFCEFHADSNPLPITEE